MTDSVRTIAAIERLKSSHYGNPRFRITFDDGSSAVTSSEAVFCYAVGNADMREGSRVLVEWTRAGRIAHMEGA